MEGPAAVILVGVMVLALIAWDRSRRKPTDGAAPATNADPIWSGMPGPAAQSGPIVTRQYKGHLADATALFQRDSVSMAAAGYYPTSQVYQQGSWGCGAFLIALLLAIFLIGILIFIYLIIVKPPGILVVTYEYRPQPAG